MSQNVAVVIGVGGMGRAIAERIGAGNRLLVADANHSTLNAVAEQLRSQGYRVTAEPIDVSSRESVSTLATQAASLGEVRYVVHTAGLSPTQATVPRLLAVNLLGVALTIEEFTKVVAPGGAGVVTASTAAYRRGPFTPEETIQLATTPADELLSLPLASPNNFPDAVTAYSFAKRANLVRIQGASVTWGAKGARINTISPGIIATPMLDAELASGRGAQTAAIIEASNAKRIGTPTDIAAAAEFLLSPASGFISGVDLLVDGGVTAAVQTGHVTSFIRG
jgi:NAD(P)-dependent dehydrogenase (short-subunit alcohol dehydrogenase family)